MDEGLRRSTLEIPFAAGPASMEEEKCQLLSIDKNGIYKLPLPTSKVWDDVMEICSSFDEEAQWVFYDLARGQVDDGWARQVLDEAWAWGDVRLVNAKKAIEKVTKIVGSLGLWGQLAYQNGAEDLLVGHIDTSSYVQDIVG
ncbi:hypothetical protein HPP92_016640 [Vanilla planifolia]|uniref:Uncharacterized protein n=1 Tax=Vanilla planifolia TaxID=51239 RepID=A0A835QLV5_VANPL|nr:hypothetical protein HPP92_016640 [Vanilla planifolia]